MNPNTQVALISVIATCITTSGVIIVALINTRKPKEQVEPKSDNSIDDGDVLDRLMALISENERKEKQIANLKEQVRKLKSELNDQKPS